MIRDIKVIAVRRDELPVVSDRDAADSQTPSCIKNPEQGVMVGRGTVLLTFFVSVIIIKQYIARREGQSYLWS
jgi:hypothetical protein